MKHSAWNQFVATRPRGKTSFNTAVPDHSRRKRTDIDYADVPQVDYCPVCFEELSGVVGFDSSGREVHKRCLRA